MFFLSHENSEIKRQKGVLAFFFWFILACLFGCAIYFFSDDWLLFLGENYATSKAESLNLSAEFFAGYFLEILLSADNLFLFFVIFQFFSIPEQYHRFILFFGIFGAAIFRTIVILFGVLFIHIKWVELLLGGFLIFTGIKVLFSSNIHQNLSNNKIICFLKQKIPVSSTIEGNYFFVKKNRKILATPLFLALISIEIIDVLFACDSISAILGVTRNKFIILTSNMFALLSLRSLFFVIVIIIHKIQFLHYALGFILCFIGIKMLWLDRISSHGKFSIIWSLVIIVTVLLLSFLLSYFFSYRISKKQ